MNNKLWGLLIGLVLTVFFTLPLFNNFSDHLSSRQDGVLIAWLIDWGSHSLLTGDNFFNAPFFHPQQNTIAYSDQFFSTALFNIPLKIIQNNFFNSSNQLNNLIFNHNFHLFAGSILTFWGQYLLTLHLLKSKKIAIFSAITFAFSSMHLDYMVHLHTFLIAGLPFYFLFLLKYLETKKNTHLALMSLFLIYQLLNSPLTGFFIIILSLTSLLNKNIRLIIWGNIKQILPFLIGIFFITSFFYWPFLKVTQEFNYTRSIRDTAHFSLSANQLFSTEIIFYFLLFLILLFYKEKKQKTPKYFWLFFSFTILGGLLMLGPVLKISGQTFKIFNLPIPLPYTLFYYLFPGFKAFRSSSRWIIVFLFGLSITLGYLLQMIKLKKNKYKNILINLISLGTFLLLWFTQVPQMKLHQINTNLPQIYQIIKQRPEKSLAEFPTYVWSQTNNYYLETDRLLYQSYHHKKLYNGYSGFIPPLKEDLWHTISDRLSEPEIIKHLKDSGIELVLLNINQKESYKNFSSPSYQLITCQNQTCLYYLK
jgi:hypothetical protein